MTTTLAPASTRTVDGRSVPAAGRYVLDGAHTTVDFVARHLMVAKVRGSFADVEGSVTVGDDATASDLKIAIDAASVTTRDEGRDAHLRSADFFDVDHYPTIAFRASRVRPTADGWVADGELTVRDVTQTVELPFEFLGSAVDPWGGSRLAFSASTEIDREQFGLTWNAALESGGVLVGKLVKIEIEAEFVREV